MTPNQRLQVAQDEYKEIRQELHEAFKDEPATKGLIDAFKTLDEIAEGLVAK